MHDTILYKCILTSLRKNTFWRLTKSHMTTEISLFNGPVQTPFVCQICPLDGAAILCLCSFCLPVYVTTFCKASLNHLQQASVVSIVTERHWLQWTTYGAVLQSNNNKIWLVLPHLCSYHCNKDWNQTHAFISLFCVLNLFILLTLPTPSASTCLLLLLIIPIVCLNTPAISLIC